MIRKMIIAARPLAMRSNDDRGPVVSPSGADENSPGRESGDHDALPNPPSPEGVTERGLSSARDSRRAIRTAERRLWSDPPDELLIAQNAEAKP